MPRSSEKGDETRVLRPDSPGGLSPEARKILNDIFLAMQEKGYDPVRQIAHYLLTGEPAYITAHRNARSLVRRLERDEVVEAMVRLYLLREIASGELAESG